MAEATKIEWADDTFNPWIGCTKISDACDFCYAEDWSKRYGRAQWGNHPRQRTGASTWAQPRKWNREAKEAGKPRFVFCASLADVFDNQVPTEWRDDLWALIRECDSLVWLLLTKRPQNIAKMLPANWGEGWPHVWLGTTVEHQEAANRNIPELLWAPGNRSKRFLSCEPLLGPIDLSEIDIDGHRSIYPLDWTCDCEDEDGEWMPDIPPISWVIAGGESGPNARPSKPDWFRSLRDQCAAAGVPFLFKQWGEWIDWDHAIDLDGLDVLKARTRGDGGETSIQYLRAGKSKAGRVLDGVTHDGRPQA
ncbi:phage Gp37/Gp68 family protein [Thalassovita mediterranea]|nr:phage Gp37/Gp68 family protein [Thalassovita mediterranea]